MRCLVFNSNAAASFEGFLQARTVTKTTAHPEIVAPYDRPLPIQVARCCGLMSWCNKAGCDSKQKEHCCGSRCYRANPGEIHGRPLPRYFQVEMFSDDCVDNESLG